MFLTVFLEMLALLGDASHHCFPGGSDGNQPAMWETWIRFLDWDDPLEAGMATHSSILAWRIPMDRGAWRAIVHMVAENRTPLSD